MFSSQNHVIKYSSHGNKEILRANIEIVALLVKLWKPIVRISKVGRNFAINILPAAREFRLFMLHAWYFCWTQKPLLDWLQNDGSASAAGTAVTVASSSSSSQSASTPGSSFPVNSSSNTRITAIQVLGLLVANGIPLYDKETDADISEWKFLEIFLSNLSHSLKDVYASTAEVCGLALLQQHQAYQLQHGMSLDDNHVSPTPSVSFSLSQHQQSQQQPPTVLDQLLKDKVTVQTLFITVNYLLYWVSLLFVLFSNTGYCLDNEHVQQNWIRSCSKLLEQNCDEFSRLYQWAAASSSVRSVTQSNSRL